MSISVGYAPVVPPPPPPRPGAEPAAEPGPRGRSAAAADGRRPTSARVTALTRSYNRKGKVALARLVCRTGPCTVDAPKRSASRSTASATAPRSSLPATLEQGQRGTLRIQLSKRALAALAENEVTSKLTFTVRNATESNTQTLTLTLNRAGVTVG